MPHQELPATFRGNLVTPRDGGYDEVRKLYNGMIEKRPRFIVRCTDVADVIDAINFGRGNELLIAIRGGGHNGGGLGSCDDGLMIDLAPMKGVRVDPDKRTVRVGPGCTQGDVDHATHAFGLAVPAGIVSSTGISGLTLGGGHGYLTRQCGLTIDNLIEADVVLADGSFVTASATQNEDLFWALRGGGGNFGVVTSFLFRAHPVRTVYAGPILWDFAHAREIMQWYREFLPSAPEELCTFLGLKKVPASEAFPRELWGKVICALISSYNGDAESGEKAMKPARESLPQPLVDAMGPMPFPALQSMFDPLLPQGLQWYWKGDFVKDLPDEAIDAYLAHAKQMPGELSLVHLYPIDGAVHRVAPDETAWRFRDSTWSMVIAGIDSDARKARELVEWGRGYWESVHPFAAGAAYVNFMMEDEGQDRIRATYGANYERLVAIKTRYDPANLFRVNQNIPGVSQPRTKH
jgi:FAD/FMN-containing dehydrogenase